MQRPPCLYDGRCDSGCPIGALANPLVTYVPRALAAGAEFRPRCTATRVLLRDGGGGRADRVAGVLYADATGEEHRVLASGVVLAAFSVQTPRLLLASATDRFPDGLANRSGAVGRYMMAHVSGDALGLFSSETEPYRGITGSSLVCQDSYDAKAKADFFGSYQWLVAWCSSRPTCSASPTRGPSCWARRCTASCEPRRGTWAASRCSARTLPASDNRVTLGAARDAFGVPRAEVTHRYAPDTLRLHAAAMAEGERVLRAAGATEAWAAPMAQQHILGKTIMGTDPACSVANGFGQAHDHENLFLAGAGLFPTSGAVNPTFTLSALAARTTDHINRIWSSLL